MSVCTWVTIFLCGWPLNSNYSTLNPRQKPETSIQALARLRDNNRRVIDVDAAELPRLFSEFPEFVGHVLDIYCWLGIRIGVLDPVPSLQNYAVRLMHISAPSTLPTVMASTYPPCRNKNAPCRPLLSNIPLQYISI